MYNLPRTDPLLGFDLLCFHTFILSNWIFLNVPLRVFILVEMCTFFVNICEILLYNRINLDKNNT